MHRIWVGRVSSATRSTIRLLFNPNGAILNHLPLDVLAEVTRETGPSYLTRQMLVLAEDLGRRDGA